MEVTPENSEELYQARKNFYNVPPRPPIGVKRKRPEQGDEERHIYWMRENMHVLCMELAPLKWVGENITPYSFMPRGGQNPTNVQRGYNRIVRHLKDQWLRRTNTSPNTRLTIDYLPPTRFSPATEAGWLRNERRRRDRRKRARIASAGGGLAGLRP
jgi:hypothetical protein